ncbi:MAG: methionine aminotransferase [Bacteroidota bacterium]
MIQSKLPNVGTTIFSVMSKMAVEQNALNLSQGFPDFPVSEELISLISEAMKSGKNQYAPMPGLPLLREQIAEKILKTGGRRIDPDTEITITAGATEALFATIISIIKTDEEVIVLEPTYDSYIPAIQLAGGIPVPIPLNQPDFSINWEVIEQKVTDKTRLLLINSPHNPSGSIISKGDIERLIKVLDKNPNLLVLSDEVYEHLIFDEQQHQSVLNYPTIADRCIAVYSFGKTFHATGWKTGYVVASPAISAEIRKVHQYLTFSVHTPSQFGIAEYLRNANNYLSLPAFYQKKRDLFLKSISGSRFKVIESKGTYFQLLDYSEITDEKDTEFAKRLVDEFRIAAIPISVFYTDQKDDKLLRFCFAKKEDTLVKAGEIIRSI